MLDVVRAEGDWEAWLDFFLEGVVSTAGSAVDTAQRLLVLFRDDAERIQSLGRGVPNAQRVFEALRIRPIGSVKDLATRTGVSFPTAAKTVESLTKLGIVSELTGRRRDRMFAYGRYLEILSEGTEPL